MAAAYASVVSLLNTMDQIHNHPRLSTSFRKYQIKYLREKVDFFLDFVENYSDADSEEAEDLVRRIAVAAHAAEDIIEVQAADRIGAASTEKSHSFLADLQMIIEDMDSIKEKALEVKEETGFITRSPMPPPSSSVPPATANTTTMVGFEDYSDQLLDQLIGHHSGRRIIPIVGMGGIGKTTLARNAYENSRTAHYFDVRAWIIVSQEYSAREILLQALSCLGRSASKMDRTDDQLGEELYKILIGRRYLIVLDDIWSVEAWEKIKFFFPENNNGSRIVVTTRQSELVDYFGSPALVVKFLDDKNSWDLFCEKTFAQQVCPPELEQVGKKIVKKCKGLPLAIIVIGGLLRQSPRTQEYWEKIVKDKSLILDSGEGNKPSSILYLSYKHLPVCLKSCFLYLGLFPEDHHIDVSQLIKLWIAEGFIKSNRDQSLEEVAESCVKDLVDRNLLLVHRLRLNRKIETCLVHDLVRDMCLRIGEKENFYCVQRDKDGKRHFIVDQTTARFYPQQSHRTSKKPSLVHPLIVHGKRAAPYKSRLLRVLSRDTGGLLYYSSREVNLRFLLNESSHVQPVYDYHLPSSISLLWSLQTLIVRTNIKVVAPSEIWEMTQLRHIEISKICVPDPPPSCEHDNVIVLQNLQTLKKVKNLNLSEEVCKRIPNIKDLHILYGFSSRGGASSCYHLQKIVCFNKLESLQYSCNGLEYAGDSLRNLILPSSLKELTLHDCKLVWSDMAMIASLPNLQILKLEKKAVVGGEWNFVDEKFVSLKHLHVLHCGYLINWIAESSNFPVLETLSLWHLSKLEEIPSDIGEIHTLERMYMYGCSESACISAVKIVEEQESLGNLGIQLLLGFPSNTKAAILLREKIQQLGFTCQNLRINGEYYHSSPETYE